MGQQERKLILLCSQGTTGNYGRHQQVSRRRKLRQDNQLQYWGMRICRQACHQYLIASVKCLTAVQDLVKGGICLHWSPLVLSALSRQGAKVST